MKPIPKKLDKTSEVIEKLDSFKTEGKTPTQHATQIEITDHPSIENRPSERVIYTTDLQNILQGMKLNHGFFKIVEIPDGKMICNGKPFKQK